MNMDPLAIALKQYAKICKTHRVNDNLKLNFKHKLVSYYMNSLAQSQRSQAAGCDINTRTLTVKPQATRALLTLSCSGRAYAALHTSSNGAVMFYSEHSFKHRSYRMLRAILASAIGNLLLLLLPLLLPPPPPPLPPPPEKQ
jgi:hypothetical protein